MKARTIVEEVDFFVCQHKTAQQIEEFLREAADDVTVLQKANGDFYCETEHKDFTAYGQTVILRRPNGHLTVMSHSAFKRSFDMI